MGNPKRPKKPWHNTRPTTIDDGEPGGGGVAVDGVPAPTWRVRLEDLARTVQVHPEVTVRGRWSPPRFAIYAGEDLIGFVPREESAEIREAMELYGEILHGRVESAEGGEVIVVLTLGGR